MKWTFKNDVNRSLLFELYVYSFVCNDPAACLSYDPDVCLRAFRGFCLRCFSFSQFVVSVTLGLVITLNGTMLHALWELYTECSGNKVK